MNVDEIMDSAKAHIREHFAGKNAPSALQESSFVVQTRDTPGPHRKSTAGGAPTPQQWDTALSEAKRTFVQRALETSAEAPEPSMLAPHPHAQGSPTRLGDESRALFADTTSTGRLNVCPRCHYDTATTSREVVSAHASPRVELDAVAAMQAFALDLEL
jgi:hypothetical protein